MQVGDLVQLSSYGRSRGFNDYLTTKEPGPDRVGLVIKIEKGSYPYIVQWTKINPHSCRDRHNRKELKLASR